MPHNHLIELLPRRDRERLLAVCEPTQLVLSAVLCEPGGPTPFVYFPTGGFISLVTLPAGHAGHAGVEVGLVGCEGMLGAQLALGVAQSPLRGLVQGTGTAWRVHTKAFVLELGRSAPLRRYMGRYLYVLMAQLATSVACLRFHLIGPRLARWLLMTQDRAQADTFQVTQEFLGLMLGVRRVSITHAASALQRDGLIEYSRGEMAVLDRARLEHAACDCYETDRQNYAEQLQGNRPPK